MAVTRFHANRRMPLAHGYRLSAGALLAAVCAAPAGAQNYAEQVVELVNVQRWANGMLPPLKQQSVLMGVGQAHSQNMATRNFFMHCDPDTGTQPWDRMTAAGYSWTAAAENIVVWESTPATAVAAWMASSQHRSNILSDYRETGVGYALDSGDTNNVRWSSTGCAVSGSNAGPYMRYWTQVFGTSPDVYPVVIAREAYAVSSCLADVYVYGSDWAQQMRFSDDGNSYGNWQPYSANVTRTLVGTGVASLTVQLRNAGTTLTSTDSVVLNLPCGGVPGTTIFVNGVE